MKVAQINMVLYGSTGKIMQQIAEVSRGDGIETRIFSAAIYDRFNKNASEMRFRYYKSTSYNGQQAIALFKFAGHEHAYTTEISRVEATCEKEGLETYRCSVCDEKITIRMAGRAESLNAAAAASITMWELVK